VVEAIADATKHTDLSYREIPEDKLAALLIAVDDWDTQALNAAHRLVQKQEAENDRCARVQIGGLWLTLPGILSTACWGSTMVRVYIDFILGYTREWANWTQDLAQFYPGGKHHEQYLHRRCRDRWGRRMTQAEITWFQGVGREKA